jgi:hypothetical protein
MFTSGGGGRGVVQLQQRTAAKYDIISLSPSVDMMQYVCLSVKRGGFS